MALLTAVSLCFALGAATTEQFKHLAAAEAGPLAGLAALPGLRTLRPALAAIADRADPLELQRMFAAAMLAADPVTSGVYYVDDHFVPYTGAKPVGKGWNNKRGRAEKGRADTHVTAHDGRAVCFVTGEPSGLTVTLPKALAELKKAAGPGAKIMLGFDRGGAYPASLHALPRAERALGDLPAGAAGRPGHAPGPDHGHRRRQNPAIAWAEEKVQLKDYGEARQLTLFEHGRVVLQILTSDFESCPAEILDWLKSRWREENFLKYASENYGIDKICDYAATIEVNTKITANPARKTANAAVRDADNELAAAERALAALLADPDTTAAAKNKAIPAASRAISAAKKKAQARHRRPRQTSRRNCPPTRSTPTPAPPCCAPGAAACRWCSGCSPTTPSTGSPPTSTPTCATTTNTAPSPAKPSSAASQEPSPSPPPRSPSPCRHPSQPASPEPSPWSSTRSTPSRPTIPATTGPSPTASTRARHLTPGTRVLPEIWGRCSVPDVKVLLTWDSEGV